MKVYVKSTKVFTYNGKIIRALDGESKSEAVARYKAEEEKALAEAEEAKRLAKEEKLKRAELRKTTPRYQEQDIVLGKDGYYYELYNPYYNKYDEQIYYDAIKTDRIGNWLSDDFFEEERYGDFLEEIAQSEIKKKIGHRR